MVRKNYAAYVDLAYDPTRDITIGAAARFEHYDDASGDTLIWKVNGRYAVTPWLALRAAANTSFRAPAAAQQIYTQTTNLPKTKAFLGNVAPVGPMSQRAQMSVKLMTAKDKISFDDFVSRKVTTTSLMAERMLPDLLAAAAGSADPDVQAAVALLKGWDQRYEADSHAALLFETWAGIFAPKNFTDQSNYAVKWTLDDPLETPRGLKDPAASVAMLKQAVAKTWQLYGVIDRPYGEVSRFHIGDVSLPANGGFGNSGVFRTLWITRPDVEKHVEERVSF